MKRTLIIGASNNPSRYSYKAANDLIKKGHKIIPFGVKRGEVLGVEMENDWNSNWEIDTVTMYVNPKIQEQYIEDIIALNPKRVIFNPGTENPELYSVLEKMRYNMKKPVL